MKQDLTDEEFDVYLRSALKTYLLRLERNPMTSEDLFTVNVENLINQWCNTFYKETNRKNQTVHHNEQDLVAEAITNRWMMDKEAVIYVNSRVEIKKEELILICKDIVDKFYINPPYARAFNE